MESTELNGLINVLKPPGMTSHDVIYFIRKTLHVKKAGHTGTLDPGVAGVLPVCVGRATKIIEYLNEDIKVYRAELTLGRSTDTQDGFGRTVSLSDASSLTCEDIEKELLSFIGEQYQIPPMVSAIKHKGKKLYELARKGIEIERKPRKIHVFDIKVIRFNAIGTRNPRIMFDVKCSKGTYVRTLCHDLGDKLGCGGFMSFLIRTATGRFHISSSLTLEEIWEMAANNRINENFVSMEEVIPFESVWVNRNAVSIVKHGNRLYFSGVSSTPSNLYEDQLVKLMSDDNGCLAIAKYIKGNNTDSIEQYECTDYFQPVKVF